MSLIKAYYVTRVSGSAGYSYDGNTFENIGTIPSAFSPNQACVGIDPTNGNKVVFAGGNVIRTSIDNGQTLDTPGGTWSSQSIGVDAGNGSRVLVLDANTIYIYGINGLYKSIDGGNNFNVVNSDFASLVSFTIGFSKLYMSDALNGILGLSNTGVNPPPVKLFKTSDGGTTWSPITGFDSLNSADQICGVHVSTNGNKLVVGGKSRIYLSTDSGATWTVSLSFSSVNTNIYGAALDAVNDDVMYALGGNNTVYKTINGGLNWSEQSSSPGTNSHLFSFYSETEGFTSRSINGVDTILRSFDSGVTWSAVDTADSVPLDLQSVFYNCGECPEGFTKNPELDQCDGKSLGPLLCPPGFEYDTIKGECIGTGNCPPSEIVFVLDIGASVTTTEKSEMQDFLFNVVAAPNIQLGLQNGTIKLGFCVFSGSAPISQGLALTNNIVTINNYISNFSSINVPGSTNTPSGLETGVNILFGAGSDSTAFKKMVVVTDGYPASLNNAGTTQTQQTFVLDNGIIGSSWTIANNSFPPCGRSTGSLSDCTRCDIYATTMEMADFIKNTFGVSITLAILSGDTEGNLNTYLTPSQNPSGANTIEGYVTYRAFIDGYLDLATHIFPPSQDSSSPLYIASGYEPPSPINGGWLNLLGLTGVTTGISFGRLIYGAGSSSSSYTSYSSISNGAWPALPSGYISTLTGNSLLSTTTTPFNPLGLWNCNEPGDPPNTYAPFCSYKLDGVTPDVYVSSFAEAGILLAPEIAQGICSASISVSCDEDCDLVVDGKNARCECPKTVFITPCVYNIYSCSNSTTPVYCTIEDLSAYVDPNIIVRISVDGPEVQGCYRVATTDVDYCEPLDYSIVNVIEFYSSCAECQPNFVRLTSCTNEEVYIQVESADLVNNIGKSVELFEYPALCWRVDLEPTYPLVTTPVTVKQIYDDCICCQQYSCKS